MNNKMDTENDVGGNCDSVCSSSKTNALATMFASSAGGGASNGGGGSSSTGSSSNNNNSSASNNNNNNNISSNHIEQPQTKRQKIDKYIKCNTKHSSKAAGPTLPTGTALNHTPSPPPDILDTGEKCTPSSASSTSDCAQHLCSSLSSSAHSISTPSGSSSNTSPTSTPSSSRATSLTHLLNVQSHLAHILPLPASSNCASAAAAHELATAGAASSMGPSETRHSCSGTTSSGCSSADHSADEVDRVVAGSRMPDLLPLATNGAATARTKPPSNAASTTAMAAAASSSADEASAAQDMREFEESLVKQCLCGVPERMLRKPFQSHYSISANGQKRIANLSEWPTNKLLQFLSNLQLLFDIYLRQNSKGFICGRIMDVCDALIRNDQNLIDEIIVLAGYGNAYVQFLAGRVLASFLVIAKQEMDNDWLKKLVENLFNFERLDHLAIQKIHFSLEIIKRIVEWKDVDVHPLEDELVDARGSGGDAGGAAALPADPRLAHMEEPSPYMHFQAQQPSLENNYFAVHFRGDDDDDEDGDDDDEEVEMELERRQRVAGMPHPLAGPSATYSPYHHQPHQQQPHHGQHPYAAVQRAAGSAAAPMSPAACQVIPLTDSESFDTTHLKCVTIKILENKWPALVKNMSTLITQNHMHIANAENCILNFLQLWESIISVKANLSITETLPFNVQLEKFELLLSQNLSCTVYKQMLCLFNEALCYGSTLALQDMLPAETCLLAHQIVRHVKDYSILESLPRRQPENTVSLIGFKRRPIAYAADGSLRTHYADAVSQLAGGGPDLIEMDKTILQKMVLLVLKSIAVTVKEIRSDSSDSSIDSTDFDAMQDMALIERSIRDVLRKLEVFIKRTLDFHPECHFSKILIHLFDDQDDHLIEAMVCTLDVTAVISFRNNTFPELVAMLNPVYTFLEFLKLISNSSDLLLDLLVNNETCFLLYLLRFLKYIRSNWPMFVQSCHDCGMGSRTLDDAMTVLIQLRLQISRLVSRQLYPYEISPVLRLLENCESLYEGNELS